MLVFCPLPVSPPNESHTRSVNSIGLKVLNFLPRSSRKYLANCFLSTLMQMSFNKLPQRMFYLSLIAYSSAFHASTLHPTSCSSFPSPIHKKKTECLMSKNAGGRLHSNQILTRGSLTFSLKVFRLSLFNSFYKRLRFSFTVNVECEITFSQRLDLFQIREIEHESPTTVTITVSVSVPVTVAVDVNCQCD